MWCADFEPLLSDLVDGSLARDVRAQVEAHLERCADCRALVSDLRQTKELARALPRMTAPESLWPKVGADFQAQTGRAKRLPIAAAAAARTEAPAVRQAPLPGFFHRRPAIVVGLAAAAVFVLSASAGLYFMTRHALQPTASTSTAAPTGSAQPVESVETELDQADLHYQNAIAALEQSARDGQAVLDPQTAAVLQKNMGVVDQAIRESRAAVRTDPTSEAAQSTLLEALQRKVGLLRDTISLINEMRKGDAAGTARVAGRMGKS
jgi:Putative zinc-finger